MHYRQHYSYASLVLMSLCLNACTVTMKDFQELLFWQKDSDDSAVTLEQDTEYTVKSGDTLYSIAWLHDLDPNQLALWNKLDPAQPKIYAGQRLSLVEPEPGAAPLEEPPQKELATSEYVVAKGDTLYSIAKAHHLDYRQLASSNSINLNKPTIYIGQRLRLPEGKPAPAATTEPPQPAKPPAQAPAQKKPPQDKKISWLWPLAEMSKPVPYRKGFRIEGRPGQVVRTVADGVVVYSGFGLKHYEGLVIVKHAQGFFSTYGFVSDITVEKGAQLVKGQEIARLADHKKAKLYFDMRHKNRRLNPMHYMPKVF